MFTTLLAIAGAVILFGGVVYFVYTYWAQITAAWDWVQIAAASVSQLVPSWLLPVLGVVLLVTVIGIILKVI